MVLILLAILIAALVVCAVAAGFVPRRIVTLATAAIALLVILLALAALVDADEMTTLALPFGPAGAAMRLALDPLGACFLLVLFLAGACCALFDEASQGSRASLPAVLAAMALTVLAADGFGIALGLLLLGLSAPRSPLRLTMFAAVCLIAAFALAVPASVAWLAGDFAAIRATPPEGWSAGAVLVLVLLGAGSLAAQVNRPTLPAIAGTTTGLYLLIRLLLDLCGPAQPLWWGVPLLLVGTIGAVVGSLRAALASNLQSVLSVGSLHQLGLAVVGVGVALCARAVDLPGVALLALDAAWLLIACHVLCRTLLLLCAGAVEAGAGTQRLDRLGGMIHRMPVTAICTLAGLFGVAVLPPGLGFAGFWLLFQSLLATARIGGFGLQLLIAVVAALIALSVGLAAFASVRLFGVVFLGRPRTPRTAVAEEGALPTRGVLIGLASLTGLLGLVPALALLPAVRALAVLANGGSAASAFAMTLQAGAEAPGYAPVVIAALLLIAGCALLWLLHRGVVQRQRQEAAWSGGFAPPPAWLPFGDPATQYGPVSFADPLLRAERSLLAKPEVTARGIVAKLAIQHDRLLHALIALGNADASRSVAAALVVIVLATVVWLVVS